MTTPSVGIAQTGGTVTSADVILDPTDISYPEASYAALSPTSAMATMPATLPVTFTVELIPGATKMMAAVIGTNIAGNDPKFWNYPPNTDTSVVFDGTGFTKGQTYWWGAWQTRKGPTGTTWTSESLLFPIVFQ
jgi:hypothetical protein